MIELAYKLLTKLGITTHQDKVLHALVGFAIAFIVSFFSQELAVILGVVAGVGKELYDKYVKKTMFDFFDLFATFCGVFTGVVAYGVFFMRDFLKAWQNEFPSEVRNA